MGIREKLMEKNGVKSLMREDSETALAKVQEENAELKKQVNNLKKWQKEVKKNLASSK